MLLRRRHALTPPAPRAPGLTSVSVHAEPDGAPAAAPTHPAGARALLRRITAEALILQDAAEALLADVRDNRDLAAVAPQARRLKVRFVELRDALPQDGDAHTNQQAAALAVVLRHHLLMLNAALDLLAGALRSPRAEEQLERIDGLGAPAAALERLAADVLGFGRDA